MGLYEAVRTCLSKYASFSGRAARSEYWWWVLFVVLGNFAFALLDGMVFGFDPKDAAMFGGLFGMAILLPTLAVTARRMHDGNCSGWWQGAPYALMIGAGMAIVMNAVILLWAAGVAAMVLLVLLLVWLIRKGTDGANRFGPDPLSRSGAPPDRGRYHRSSIPRVGRD